MLALENGAKNQPPSLQIGNSTDEQKRDGFVTALHAGTPDWRWLVLRAIGRKPLDFKRVNSHQPAAQIKPRQRIRGRYTPGGRCHERDIAFGVAGGCLSSANGCTAGHGRRGFPAEHSNLPHHRVGNALFTERNLRA